MHLEAEQLPVLHFVLRHAVQASRWQGLACMRVVTKAVVSSEVGAQALDVEPWKDTPRRRYVEPVRVWRSAREDSD